MTQLEAIELDLKILIRDLETSKASRPDDWDDCDERVLALQKRIKDLFFTERIITHGKHDKEFKDLCSCEGTGKPYRRDQRS